jgi:hypothetical protein
MVSPLGGQAPGRTPTSTQQGDVRTIQARGRGTLSETVAAKANQKVAPQDRSQVTPHGEAMPHNEGDGASRGSSPFQDVRAQKEARAVLRESLGKLSMAMRPADMVSFMSHAFDKRHITRFRTDPVKLLEPALKQMKEVRPLPEIAGHGFVAHLPGEHKIMGKIDSLGWVKPRTFYGPGQAHDKRRGDVDITKAISDIKNKMKGDEGGQLLGEQL